MNRKIELPEPWYWTDQDLVVPLKKEINRMHVLYGKVLRTLARRQDNDDVLIMVNGETFAVVHLTWVTSPPIDRQWPITDLYKTWDDVYMNRILADKQDFEQTQA